MSEQRGLRKTREGVVVSDKMDKTIVVEIKTRVRHPLYGKIMNQTSKLKAHDEKQRVRRRRPRARDGNPPAEPRQALALGRNRRKGQVIYRSPHRQKGPAPSL